MRLCRSAAAFAAATAASADSTEATPSFPLVKRYLVTEIRYAEKTAHKRYMRYTLFNQLSVTGLSIGQELLQQQTLLLCLHRSPRSIVIARDQKLGVRGMYLRAKASHSADKPDEAKRKRMTQRLEALTLVTACSTAGAWITKSEINVCN